MGPPKATWKLLTSKRTQFLEQTDGTVYNSQNRWFITWVDVDTKTMINK